jgi:hypothetical protein
MISRAVATRYDKVADGGRNQPLLVLVETDAGVEHEVYMKPSGRPEMSVTGMAHEVLASCIGGHVGLPVCKPFLVELLPEWIESVPDPAVRAMLEASNPIAFASEAAGLGWLKWTPEEILTAARRPDALAIFAFDLFAENPDRKPSNPNLLFKGDAFKVIDHELALMVRVLFPRPTPWQTGYASMMLAADRHVFAAKLKGGTTEVGPIRSAWAGLSDADLSAYVAALPPEWAEATDSVTAAVTHIRAVRDRIDECLAEMRRALI